MTEVVGIIVFVALMVVAIIFVYKDDKRMKEEHKVIQTFFKNANVLVEYKLECYGLTGFDESEEN